MVAVYIIRLFSAVRQHCPLAPASRNCASYHWKDDVRDPPPVWHGCWDESCLFSVTGMCLHCSLVGTVIAKSACILPSSSLRNLKRTGTKAIRSRGKGKRGWIWEGNIDRGLFLLEGGWCISGEQGSWGNGEVKWRVPSGKTSRFFSVGMMMLWPQKEHEKRNRSAGQGKLVLDLICLPCWWDNQVETDNRHLEINSWGSGEGLNGRYRFLPVMIDSGWDNQIRKKSYILWMYFNLASTYMVLAMSHSLCKYLPI